MKKAGCVCTMMTVLCFVYVLFVSAADTQEPGTIDVGADMATGHPVIEPGLSCIDCHDFRVDADTTATNLWLFGELPGRPEGEGVMPEEMLVQEIRNVIGGIKRDTKTFVIGTSLNNRPLTTTAEFTLDPDEMILYGFHEAGTEKLFHIQKNPWVSLNYHRQFAGDFDNFLCCQILGHAELIDGQDPEFDRILAGLLPYEEGARMPADMDAEQREKHLKQFRKGLQRDFYISKIRIDRLTILNMDFVKKEFRRAQRWERTEKKD